MLKRSIALSFVMFGMFAAPVFGARVIDGRFGPGALYRIVEPTVWNGSLVLYAHGAVEVNEPIALPAEANLIARLLVPQGFAVAFTSFSENGWAVKDGAQRTEQLLGIFKSKVGRPARVYIAGASLGGLIAIKLAETHPGVYSGALPVCAIAGGSRREFDYLGNVRALFDLLYPGVLPGDAGNVRPGIDIPRQIIAPAAAAMLASPTGAGIIAAIMQTPVPGANPQEVAQSILTALALHADAFNDISDRLHHHAFFDNRQTIYTSTLLPVNVLRRINAGIQRFDASPSALEYLEHYYNPSGDLHVPMLMLSNTRDPEVPSFNQTSYARLVASKGASDLLVNRTVDTYGHCVFTPQQLGQAFADLVLWAETGRAPAP